MSSLIYHLVPQDDWAASPPDRPYTPAAYAHEGFIHCTSGEKQLAVVANRYYRNDRRVWVALAIAEERVSSQIKYEPGTDGLLYPHIYGALNRDAVMAVLPMPRAPDGTFKPLARS